LKSGLFVLEENQTPNCIIYYRVLQGSTNIAVWNDMPFYLN